MALTRDFKQTVIERVKRDPGFGKALLDEAGTLFLNGEPEMARVILRDLVNATVGFEQLATETAKPSQAKPSQAKVCIECCPKKVKPKHGQCCGDV